MTPRKNAFVWRLVIPVAIAVLPLTLSASIGFSIFPIDTPERDQVVSNAKLAMHRG